MPFGDPQASLACCTRVAMERREAIDTGEGLLSICLLILLTFKLAGEYRLHACPLCQTFTSVGDSGRFKTAESKPKSGWMPLPIRSKNSQEATDGNEKYSREGDPLKENHFCWEERNRPTIVFPLLCYVSWRFFEDAPFFDSFRGAQSTIGKTIF